MVDSFASDFRHAIRRLLRRPGFSGLAVLTLALGIGANVAIFSLLHSVLLAPLPYQDADRLAQVWNTYPLMDLPRATVSIPDYLDRRDGVAAFEQVALYTFENFNLADDGPPERVVGLSATASLFPLLGVEPVLGRFFDDSEAQPGADAVVMLSHSLWQRRFGSREDIVDRTIQLNGEAVRVVGVMPPSVQFPNSDVALWRPFPFTPEQMADEARGNEFSFMIARLAPGATVEQAQEQVDAIHEANKERFPQAREFWENSGFGGQVVDYRADTTSDLRPVLLLLQAAVAFVLLIACANVANLLLSQLQSRRKELALKAALGAGRGRVASQLLTEGIVLSLTGGLLGLGIGWLGLRLLIQLELAQGVDAALDPQVLLFSLLLALMTGLVTSLLPILSLEQVRPQAVLKEGGDRGSSGGRRSAFARNGLVVAEVACAMVLLVGAGLMVQTLAALLDESPGFETRGILTARLSLPAASYPEGTDQLRFFESLSERLDALPGVRAAGLTTSVPFSGSMSSGSYSIEGYDVPAGESAPHALQKVVDEGFFEALGIKVIQGRGPGTQDTLESTPVVIVDRRTVEKYFPDGDVLGRRLSRGETSFEIVGVVETVKTRDLDRPVTKETLYYPLSQIPRDNMTVVLATDGSPSALTEPLRRAVQDIDPQQPIYNLLTIEEQIARSLTTRRVSMVLLVLFGALAGVLAAVGIYGVLAWSVSRRVREIGTRVALGASRTEILRLILRRGMGLTLVGLVAGLLAAFALSRFLQSQLYGVGPQDPLTLLGVALLLALVALTACLRPALKAASIPPIEALREE